MTQVSREKPITGGHLGFGTTMTCTGGFDHLPTVTQVGTMPQSCGQTKEEQRTSGSSLGLKVAEPTHRHYSQAVLILQCLLANLRCPHWWRHLSRMLYLHGKHLCKNISDLRPAVTARQMEHCRARRPGPLPESHPAEHRTFGSSPSFWSPTLILSASL